MKNTPQIFVFKTHQQLSDYAIQRWVQIARNAIQKKGFFAVALSGGKTPIPFYRRLASLKNNSLWRKTHVFMVDERFVAPHHHYHNFRALSQNLLSRVPIPECNIHPILTDVKSEKISAGRYQKDLKGFFHLPNGKFPRFDLMLLGIGQDGHAASLFPGSRALNEKRRLAVSVVKSNVKYKRITLTLPTLQKAANILFIVTGREKSGTVGDVFKKDSRLPAALVSQGKGNVFFLLDKTASARLQSKRFYKSFANSTIRR